MQGSADNQGNQNGQKQGGLSWTQPPSGASGAKPISQVGTSAMPSTTTNKPAQNVPKPAQAGASQKKPEQKAARAAGIFIGGVVVGLIIGWGWFSLGSDRSPAAMGDENAEMAGSSTDNNGNAMQGTGTQTGASASDNAGIMASGSSSLSIAPLQPAGLTVDVSSVSVAGPTWVVIFESSNGKLGNALGAKLFFPGETGGTIELLRGTVAGHTYYAGEYGDNGDHQFSKQSDTQVEDASGSQMLVEFTVR